MFHEFYKTSKQNKQSKQSPLARLRGGHATSGEAAATGSATSTASGPSNKSTTSTENINTNKSTTSTEHTNGGVNGGGPVQQQGRMAPVTRPPWEGDEYEDLVSKDKSKQKSAVKRYLAEQVRNDWDFVWPAQRTHVDVPPPPAGSKAISEGNETNGGHVQDETLDKGYTADDQPEHEHEATTDVPCDPTLDDGNDDDDESIYSIISEDPTHYRPRIEWTSDLSENDLPGPLHSKNKLQTEAGGAGSPIRNIQQVDYTLSPAERKAQYEARRKQRRKEMREEMSWNQGLACFEARRDAWTGGRTVRVREKVNTRGSTSSKNRRFSIFRRSGSGSGSPPTTTPTTLQEIPPSSSSSPDLKRHTTNTSLLSSDDPPSSTPSPFTISTLIPLAPPLLPPTNILRASITPTVYINLYEKVVLQNMQPSCPINLGDMVRSCVVGWQRDGEWPPRPVVPGHVVKVKKEKEGGQGGGGGIGGVRRLSFGLLGGRESKEVEKEKEKEKKGGFRRSLKEVFGMGGGNGG